MVTIVNKRGIPLDPVDFTLHSLSGKYGLQWTVLGVLIRTSMCIVKIISVSMQESVVPSALGNLLQVSLLTTAGRKGINNMKERQFLPLQQENGQGFYCLFMDLARIEQRVSILRLN